MPIAIVLALAASLGIHAPFTRSKFNFVMQTATNADEALPLTRMERVTTPT